MATRNPIGNYLKGEEIDSQPYLSEGISRRGFLKSATIFTGAAILGEGLVKQMGAWAEENGTSVYIEDFTESYLTSQPVLKNIGNSVSKNLKVNLTRKGINLKQKSSDSHITILGHCEEMFEGGGKGIMVHINISYRNSDKAFNGRGIDEYFPIDSYRNKIQEISKRVYEDIIHLSQSEVKEAQSVINK